MPDDAWTIEIELPLGQTPLHFETLEAVTRFVEAEEEAWAWLTQAPGPPTQVGQLAQQATNVRQQILEKVRAALPLSGEELSAGIETIEASLRSLVNVLPIRADDHRAAYLRSMAEEALERAGPQQKEAMNVPRFAVYGLVEGHPPINRNVVHELLGICLAHVLRIAPPPSAAVDASIHQLEEQKRKWEEFASTAAHADASLTSTAEEHLRGFQDRSVELQGEFTTALGVAKERLKGLEELYRSGLQLRAPVGYWEKRAKATSTKARWGVGFFCLGVLGLAAALTVEVYGLFFSAWGQSLLAIGNDHNVPAAWPFVVVAATAGFLVWPLRLLGRWMFSNAHLSTDAEQRVTMVQTYLALLEEESTRIATSAEVRLILGELFRPVHTGLIKDDAPPPTPAGLLERLISGQK